MTTSVAVALYNGERFLYKQLESLRTQTKAPDQVVFCDDGSKDNTVAIVRDYIAKYQLHDKWVLVENENNLGYARNFYKAMSLCDADLVFLADQDDIWKQDKIEKMTAVMESHPEIALLSCKFEIIDGNDQVMHGVLARPQKESFEVKAVTTVDLLRGFTWLGMLMCVRNTFAKQLLPKVMDFPIAHDRVLSHCAADLGLFFEYDYIGAYHRRHENNTAKEEHRISKLLNLNRKLQDIEVAKKLYSDMLSVGLPLKEHSTKLMQKRLILLEQRETALQEKSISKIIKLYKDDHGILLRKYSFICDIWLTFFGK